MIIISIIPFIFVIFIQIIMTIIIVIILIISELPKHLSRGPSREHIPEQMKNKIEVILIKVISVINITKIYPDHDECHHNENKSWSSSPKYGDGDDDDDDDYDDDEDDENSNNDDYDKDNDDEDDHDDDDDHDDHGSTGAKFNLF